MEIPELLMEVGLSGARSEGIEKNATEPIEEIVCTVDRPNDMTCELPCGRSRAAVIFFRGTIINYDKSDVREESQEASCDFKSFHIGNYT